MIITTENIQQKETININLSALFFEGFVSHSNEEEEKDDDDDNEEVVLFLALLLLLLLFFFATTVGVKNRPRMKQERKIEAKIFAICAWIDVIFLSLSDVLKLLRNSFSNFPRVAHHTTRLLLLIITIIETWEWY
jgi:hypothetical protein